MLFLKRKKHMANDQRRVVDQTIISEALPAIEITVDPSFVFVGILSFVLKEIALVERVIFAEQQDSKTIRLFIVQFEGALESADVTYKFQITNPLQLGNHNYHHGIYMYSIAESVRDAPGAESDRTTQFL